jgi:hypothetical protein
MRSHGAPDGGEEHRKHDPLVDLGYERADISVSGIAKGALGFFGFAIGMWLVTLLIVYFWNRPAVTVPEQTGRPIRSLPEGQNPLLQSNITVLTDMHELRQREERELARSEEISPGRYRIPIDRAIDLVPDRLASRPSSVESPTLSAAQAPSRTPAPTPGLAPRRDP